VLRLDLARYAYALHSAREGLQFALSAGQQGEALWGSEAPSFGQLAIEIANLLSNQGEYESALGYNRKAVRALATAGTMEWVKAQAALGNTLLELARAQEAAVAFRSAYDKLSQNGGAAAERLALLINIINAELALGDIEEANRLLGQAEAIAAHQPKLQSEIDYARALVLSRDGRLRDAQATLGELIQRGDNELLGAHALLQLSNVLVARGLFVEAEPVTRSAIDAYGRLLSANHPIAARALHNLALIYEALGRGSDAAKIYDRAIAIETAAFGSNSAQAQATNIERAWLDINQKALASGERRARETLRALDPNIRANRRYLGFAHIILGILANAKKRPDEARREFEQGIALVGEAVGVDSPDLYLSLTELGILETESGNFAAAEIALAHAIKILERDVAVVPWKLPRALAALAELSMRTGNREKALELIRRATAMLLDRLDQGAGELSGLKENEQRAARDTYAVHARIAWELSRDSSRSDGSELIAESFAMAQAARSSSAARSINQMAARFSSAAGPLGALVRKRQDSIDQWRYFDRLLQERLAALSKDPSDISEAEIRRRLQKLREDIAELDRMIEQQFPGFANLMNPHPASAKAVQEILREGEAILAQLTTDRETFLWLVTKDIIEIVRTPLTIAELELLVRGIRRTVEFSGTSLGEIKPFDAASAYKLYQGTVKPFADRLSGVKTLLVVPDGALQSVPLTVLLEAPTELGRNFESYRNAPWLIRRFAIVTLPSVQALIALRQTAQPSRAREAFLGIGNPSFAAGLAQSANVKRSAARGLNFGLLFGHGSKVRREEIARLVPLTETAEELSRLKSAIGGGRIITGLQASERTLSNLPLSNYRILAFATHGLMAGDFVGLAEPAIALTPDSDPNSPNDGLLTASKITQLHLDADLVLLSACNTADPEGKPGAEGLGGLAQAFFYAGARSLVVSHWAVDSDATVELTTGMFSRQQSDGGAAITKSEALRRSSLQMIDEDKDLYRAHPLFWAPFVVVGDGV
jgi:CHAT domain-containing protein/TolA-binding protein